MEIIRLTIMKMNIKMGNRSYRYDISRPKIIHNISETIVFKGNSALREKFNFCFLRLFC